MKTRMIIVPMNEKAIKEMEYGLDYTKITDNDFTSWSLSQQEFHELFYTGVLERINSKCNTLIDDYENERIENELLDIALSAIHESEVEVHDVINKLVLIFEIAKKNDAFVEFDF